MQKCGMAPLHGSIQPSQQTTVMLLKSICMSQSRLIDIAFEKDVPAAETEQGPWAAAGDTLAVLHNPAATGSEVRRDLLFIASIRLNATRLTALSTMAQKLSGSI